MKVENLRMKIVMSGSDYFWLTAQDNGNFTLTISDSSRHPIHVVNVSHRHIMELVNQLSKIELQAADAKVTKLFTELKQEKIITNTIAQM